MFTGLVEAMGVVREISRDGVGARLVLAQPAIASAAKLGDSVAINGVCLTVVARDDETFAFQAGPETLAKTNLGELQQGDRVNLERALTVGDRLGGHIVQGHVDGVGRIARRVTEGEWQVIWFACPPDLNRFLVSKGSITVDGVSLTVVEVRPEGFSVALIPHTLAATTLGFKQPGDTVNLETDLIAKHLVRYLDGLDWASIAARRRE
jgi:riboflavin synthase